MLVTTLVAVLLAIHGVTATSCTAASGSTSKSGVSWPVQEGTVAPVAQFFGNGSKLAWYYDWNKNSGPTVFTADSTAINISAQFFPMFYDASFINSTVPLQSGFTTVMGYNEPDLAGAGVATAADPITAAAQWKTLVESVKAVNPAAKFVSPAMAYNTTWLDIWFKQVCASTPSASPQNAWSGCAYAPDYVSVHLYSLNATDLTSKVQAYWTEFGKPLVLSEFACNDFNANPAPNPSTADVSQFMADTTKWLDAQDFVSFYAWFGAVRNATYLYGVPESNRLMDSSGQLTALGKQYMAGGQVPTNTTT